MIGGQTQKESITGVIIILLTPAPILDPFPAIKTQRSLYVSTNQSAVFRWIWTNERSPLCIRFGFTNARSGSVDFGRSLEILTERCQSLRYLDLTFATDTLIQTKPGRREIFSCLTNLFPSSRRGNGCLQWTVSEGLSDYSEGALGIQQHPDFEALDVQQIHPAGDIKVIQADRTRNH